jgi:uncharacterized membrane protein YgcG
MKKQVTLAFVLVAASAGFAMADHNSKWGEGTALDPLGIHDARIDGLDTASDEPFQGAGIDVTIEETAFARQSRPDTIDVDAPDSGSGAGESSGSGGGSGNGGGNGNGGGGRR